MDPLDCEAIQSKLDFGPTAMRQENLRTGRGGTLHGQLWSGDREPLGIVIAVHGLGDHGGRFQPLAQVLVDQGWSLMAVDLPGHGLSPGKRGRVDSFDALLGDIASARRSAAERWSDIPQVLLGHSMGGNLAINYTLRRAEFPGCGAELSGLILCAPMLLPPKPPPRPHIFAAWLTGLLLPKLRIDRPVDIEALTGDADQAAAIAGDSLMHSKITLYLATQLLSQGRWSLDHARDIDVPMLVMYGEDDPLIDQSACQHLAIRIGRPASLVKWPHRRHDLLHDKGREEIYAELEAWLRQTNGPTRCDRVDLDRRQ